MMEVLLEADFHYSIRELIVEPDSFSEGRPGLAMAQQTVYQGTQKIGPV